MYRLKNTCLVGNILIFVAASSNIEAVKFGAA